MNGVFPATDSLLERFYAGREDRPAMTTKSVVAVRDGEPVGVAGAFVDPDAGHAVMFSNLTDEVRKDRRLLINLSRATLAAARSFGLPVYSRADPKIQGSDILLRHMGGRSIGGGIFEFSAEGA